MLTNADCTIFNKYRDKGSAAVYKRTVIRGVWWFVKNEARLTDNGLQSADVFYLRIPRHADFGGKTFVPPDQWTGDDNTWTLQQGDAIRKGVYEEEITKPSDLEKEKTQTFIVLSWSDNDFGDEPHWRVKGS